MLRDLGWEEKDQVHVIIKHMFDPSDPATIKHDFYERLKEEIRGEIEKMGPVASIKIFERNPEGVVAVKYKAPLAAQRCINVSSNRIEIVFYCYVDFVFLPCTYLFVLILRSWAEGTLMAARSKRVTTMDTPTTSWRNPKRRRRSARRPGLGMLSTARFRPI
jgi:hypothetical protein